MKPTPNTYAPVLIAAILLLTLGLGVAFLSSRAADLGSLGTLFGTMWSTLVDSESNRHALHELAQRLYGIGLGGLIVLSWLGLGLWLAALPIFRNTDAATDTWAWRWAWRGALGAGAWSLLWLGLGLCGLYRAGMAWAATVLGLAAFLSQWHAWRSTFRAWRVKDCDTITWLTGGLSFLVLALSFLASLAPPTAKDTLLYHYALPKHWLASGGLTVVPYNLASYLPLGGAMHTTWAFLLGQGHGSTTQEAAAGVVNWAFTLFLALAVYGWARRHTARVGAMLAVLLMLSIPTVFHVAANSYIDNALTLYLTLAAYAVGRWWETLERGRLAQLAVCLACALCFKLTAVFWLMALGLVILWRARNSANEPDGATQQSILIAGTGALILACLLASPWYIKTWQQTGSPFFPFYLNLIRGTADGWDVERSQLFQEINQQYGGADKTALDYVITPAKLATVAQPELFQYFDGALGIALWAGLPLVLWAWRRGLLAAELRCSVFLSGVAYLFWLFSSQQLRYLLPALPALAVAIAVAAHHATQRDKAKQGNSLHWILTGAATLGVLTTVAWFCQLNALGVVLGREPRSVYLTRHLDYLPYYQRVNSELPATAKVWLVNMRRDTYHLERPYFSDYLFEDYTLAQMVNAATDVDDLARRVHAMGVTHLLIRHDALLNPSRTVVYDARKSEAENLARLDLLKNFLLRRNHVLQQDAKFMLVELR